MKLEQARQIVDLVTAQLGAQAPSYLQLGVDRATLAYCVVVSLATGLLCGLLPALRSSRTDVHTVLKEKGALMLVPSSAVESMGMGGLLGAAALRQQALATPDEPGKPKTL